MICVKCKRMFEFRYDLSEDDLEIWQFWLREVSPDDKWGSIFLDFLISARPSLNADLFFLCFYGFYVFCLFFMFLDYCFQMTIWAFMLLDFLSSAHPSVNWFLSLLLIILASSTIPNWKVKVKLDFVIQGKKIPGYFPDNMPSILVLPKLRCCQ